MKVEEAKRLFDEKGMNVTEVSSELGFSDVKYFGAIFKKYERISPSLYIKRSTNKR
jgi:YesN/AraC family two-component response regulator